MKFSVKSLLVLLLVTAGVEAQSMCSSQLDYLHKVADKLEEKVFSDTVSTIEYRENVHYAGDTFTIKLFQKPCLVVDNAVKRVCRTVCISDAFGNFVDQRSYVVDGTAGNNGPRVSTFFWNSMWYTLCWHLGLAFFLSDVPGDVRMRNAIAIVLGTACGFASVAE